MSSYKPQTLHWSEIAKRLLYHTSFFELWSRTMRAPTGSYESDFYYFDAVDWVNIVAVTANDEVVMVEQFRHGIQSTCLELPGGMMDSREEAPSDAALRELREETGFTAAAVTSLGFIHPNPAIQTNKNFSFFARDVKKVSDQMLDQAEDISVHLIPLRDIPNLIETHVITHALVVNAFMKLLLKEPLYLKLFRL